MLYWVHIAATLHHPLQVWQAIPVTMVVCEEGNHSMSSKTSTMKNAQHRPLLAIST
jgi:hypothetical protein